MEDKKSSLYSLSNKMKNGWTQGGSQGWVASGADIPVTDTPVQPAPQMILPLDKENISDFMPELPLIPVIPIVPTLPLTPAKPIMPKCNMLGMTFMATQEWDEIYEPELGFKRGTIFPQLDFPFIGEGACRYE